MTNSVSKTANYDLAVQIVNYKSQQHLVKCLESLIPNLVQSGLNYVIKVVDNGSGDDLSSLERIYAQKPVLFFGLEHNGGFGAGHNYAFKQAPTNTKYTFILNPDTELMASSPLSDLTEVLERNAKVGAVGPALLHRDKLQVWDHGEIHGWKARIANWAGGSYYRPQRKSTNVAWVSGAALMIRSDLYRRLNGFDEQFFLFKEEEDLCLRLRQLGYRVLYEPKVQIKHVGGGSGASKNDALAKSVAYFNAKHVDKHNYVAKMAVWLYERYHLWE